jgi:hypothetical protein
MTSIYISERQEGVSSDPLTGGPQKPQNSDDRRDMHWWAFYWTMDNGGGGVCRIYSFHWFSGARIGKFPSKQLV